MPDSYGKRQRQQVKARKDAAREQRRVARNQRRADRSPGALDPASDDPSLPEEPEQGGAENAEEDTAEARP